MCTDTHPFHENFLLVIKLSLLGERSTCSKIVSKMNFFASIAHFSSSSLPPATAKDITLGACTQTHPHFTKKSHWLYNFYFIGKCPTCSKIVSKMNFFASIAHFLVVFLQILRELELAKPYMSTRIILNQHDTLGKCPALGRGEWMAEKPQPMCVQQWDDVPWRRLRGGSSDCIVWWGKPLLNKPRWNQGLRKWVLCLRFMEFPWDVKFTILSLLSSKRSTGEGVFDQWILGTGRGSNLSGKECCKNVWVRYLQCAVRATHRG